MVESVKKKRKRTLSRKRLIRLETVKDLYFVKKLNQSQIAVQLGVNQSQINKDVKILKTMAEEESQRKLDEISDTGKFLNEMVINYHTRIKKLWDIFNRCGDEQVIGKLDETCDMVSELNSLIKKAKDDISDEMYTYFKEFKKKLNKWHLWFFDPEAAKNILAEIRNQEKHYLTYLQDLGAMRKKKDKPRQEQVQYVSMLGKKEKTENSPKEDKKYENADNIVI